MKEIIIDIESLTLNPVEDEAQVVAISVKCGEFEEVLMGANEKALLTKFWGLPFFEGHFRVIGFCIAEFDLYYLLVRSFKHGVRVPDLKGRILDLRLVLNFGNKFKKGKLEDFAKLILGEKGMKNGNGADVKSLWMAGEIDKLRTYCERDLYLTFKIFERLKQMGVV
ncbi:MAG TPA: hypothetical protein VI564_02340 [Candidatus Nanoarchaeia archaeon]|nr:hypothetical protein [Candidatus Nanoarchaeia archaeon]